MSGAQQVSFMNQRSFGPPPLPAIGSAYEGGFFAGQISTSANGVATHNLVIGPRSTSQAALQWKTSNTATAGTDSAIDGPANTAAMMAAGAAAHPAGQFCDTLVTGGFSDWYMPARNELEVCYFNLKPNTSSNSTTSGINVNAVPSRGSNYTSGVPGQTSATIFRVGSTEDFNESNYFSSTQATALYAREISFFNGLQQGNAFKNTAYRVRAVRRVPV